LILLVTAILYAGIGAVIGFHNAGNLLLLALVGVVGALSMIALGLTIAARFSSEELVGGLLNVLTWPMMLLSGIWFSLEGSPPWVQWVAHVFPLTHVLDAARAVMLDGAGLPQIAPNRRYLAATALAFLAFGAWSFRWRIEWETACVSTATTPPQPAPRSWRRSSRPTRGSRSPTATIHGRSASMRCSADSSAPRCAPLRSRPAPPPTP